MIANKKKLGWSMQSGEVTSCSCKTWKALLHSYLTFIKNNDYLVDQIESLGLGVNMIKMDVKPIRIRRIGRTHDQRMNTLNLISCIFKYAVNKT